MIIICSGPDTFRAREKARDLVKAFRKKHDPTGLSVDVIDGTDGIKPLLERLGAGSLFAPKKLIRADGCLEKMNIADVRTLASRLAADADATVVLTVETDAPDKKTIDALKNAPCHLYAFPIQTETAFRAWVRARAAAMGVSDAIADIVGEAAEGDSWQAVAELQKQSASSQEFGRTSSGDASVYEIAERFISGGAWRKTLMETTPENALTTFLSQMRACLRVQDGAVAGLHPYLAKKMQRVRPKSGNERFRDVLAAMVSSRSSLAIGDEWDSVLI